MAARFPATTVGVRTDSGYRFGSFNGGAFIEPLAAIAIGPISTASASAATRCPSMTTPMSEDA
jgi:hypothetical protein